MNARPIPPAIFFGEIYKRQGHRRRIRFSPRKSMKRRHPQKSSNILGYSWVAPFATLISVINSLLRTTAEPPRVGDRVEASQV